MNDGGQGYANSANKCDLENVVIPTPCQHHWVVNGKASNQIIRGLLVTFRGSLCQLCGETKEFQNTFTGEFNAWDAPEKEIRKTIFCRHIYARWDDQHDMCTLCGNLAHKKEHD